MSAHVSFAELPDALSLHQLAQGLGISYHTLRAMRARRDWPFSTIPGLPARGKLARYSKAHVLAVIDGAAVPMRPRLAKAR